MEPGRCSSAEDASDGSLECMNQQSVADEVNLLQIDLNVKRSSRSSMHEEKQETTEEMEDIEERASMVRMTNHLREQLPDTNPKDVWRGVKDAVGDEDPREERAARVAKFTSAQAAAMPLMEMMSNNTAFMELAGEKIPVTEKVTINGATSVGSDISLFTCFAPPKGGLKDLKVCGTETAALVFLRGRCE